MIPRLILTTGESAGVGPDIVLLAAMHQWNAELVAIGCEATLTERAAQLGISVTFSPYASARTPAPHRAGSLPLIDIPLVSTCMPGKPDPANAGHVLSQLELAVSLCQSGECHAMVTAPVHKGVINDAGIPFSGHTEFLGRATDATNPVMLLTTGKLKVALATTHLPLRAVPDAITRESLKRTLDTLHEGLQQYFGIPQPRISVLGLNPHAGENGHLGNEEVSIIRPLCDEMRQSGLALSGPISGDTAFTPERRSETDAYLAMYHDQGLAVIKSEGFSNTVNVTLGLPIIRTSVDHGTALELAGRGQVNIGSMVAAIQQATNMASEQ